MRYSVFWGVPKATCNIGKLFNTYLMTNVDEIMVDFVRKVQDLGLTYTSDRHVLKCDRLSSDEEFSTPEHALTYMYIT